MKCPNCEKREKQEYYKEVKSYIDFRLDVEKAKYNIVFYTLILINIMLLVLLIAKI